MRRSAASVGVNVSLDPFASSVAFLTRWLRGALGRALSCPPVDRNSLLQLRETPASAAVDLQSYLPRERGRLMERLHRLLRQTLCVEKAFVSASPSATSSLVAECWTRRACLRAPLSRGEAFAAASAKTGAMRSQQRGDCSSLHSQSPRFVADPPGGRLPKGSVLNHGRKSQAMAGERL